jgi:hypothetical protein
VGQGAAAGRERGDGGSEPSEEEEGMVRSRGIERRLTGGDGLRRPAEWGEEEAAKLGFGLGRGDGVFEWGGERRRRVGGRGINPRSWPRGPNRRPRSGAAARPANGRERSHEEGRGRG